MVMPNETPEDLVIDCHCHVGRSLSAEELIERCREELGVVLSRRTVFRILEAEDGSKKKPKSKRRGDR